MPNRGRPSAPAAVASGGRETLPVTHASSVTVYDCGEEIWFLLQTRRPVRSGDDATTTDEAWVVLPRDGAMVSLMAAIDVLLPSYRGGSQPKGKVQAN